MFPAPNRSISGQTDSGATRSVNVTSLGHLEVGIHEPVTAFGEVMTAQLSPIVGIDAIYGLLATDHETFTDGASGSATASGSLFTCATGTTIGGYGVVRSRRLLRYRPGVGARFRFTAKFDAGVANSLLVAGAFNSEDALFVGYSGTTFGFMRRIAGGAHITRLTVTNGATGAETITVRLDGVDFAVAASGALTAAATAELIAERVGGYTGWTHDTSPTSNGSTVTFIQGTPGATSGSFTLTSTGGAVGTFATVQTGAANDSATGFVARTSWNVDTLDGSRGPLNPSGMLLDPTKLNVYEFVLPYLGAGTIILRVMNPQGEMIVVHLLQYPNSATTPSLKNPTLRLGWVAASLGSTTDLTVSGASAAAFLEGKESTTRDPFSTSTTFSAGTTEYVALAVRVRGEFGSKLCHRIVLPFSAFLGVETSNRVVQARVILNPTLTGTVNWGYVDQTLSAVEYATPTTLAPSGGRTIATSVVVSGDSIDLERLGQRLRPGDVLAVAVQTVTSSSTVAVSVNWQEI